jgi:hypothetical protein
MKTAVILAITLAFLVAFMEAIAKQKSYLFLMENAGVRYAQAILRLLNIGFFGAIGMMFDL